ncbi:DUF1801 domain-containing protein [Chitinophaga barathri]|uniref:DUF1801 domain-containing protein n=1 Tax=Chitinophaga barathri TaxID=1647451 RepID=A0A3N4M8R4_9BACT|nr:DUF1801 domain-containing protein [Chitinophaga barathri]RPD37926.1 DUF1801 domain-containing protein [Chitinophaga barathri]
MAKNNKPASEEQVADYLGKLDHPLKDVVEALREIVLATDTEIGEQVKWNSPSFYYKGEMKEFDAKEYKRDIVVFNLHKKDTVLLVFPTGAVVNDKTGFLEGKYPDGRRMAKFSAIDEVQIKKKDLQAVLKEWLKQVEK